MVSDRAYAAMYDEPTELYVVRPQDRNDFVKMAARVSKRVAALLQSLEVGGAPYQKEPELRANCGATISVALATD